MNEKFMQLRDFPEPMQKAVLDHALSNLEGLYGLDNYIHYGADLHHYLFNEDYFIIGHYQAQQFLGDHSFRAIEYVQDYEKDNFGEVSTEINDEKIANMFAYIAGEEILSRSKHLERCWDKPLNENSLKIIAMEIKQ
tara:strand:+ start:186 stop:596 length:411 start_codon:yes stop_codon:yes gene_type:complete